MGPVARRGRFRHLTSMDSLTAPASADRTDTEYFDVLIVGAGLSGIGAAWHLQKKCPGKSFAILEAREASGGTWDLFRYPGVRSDSDMYTLGYSFRPWKEAKAIADGPSILTYIREVARDHGIDKKIRYGHKVVAASWSTPDARWTVEVETGPDACTAALHLQLPVDVQRLLRLRSGLPAGVRRHRPLQGPHRPSAEMDRRHRLCRQARGRDRQRRHGGDPGAVHGGDGRARHHAAALAHLHGGAAQPGCARQQAAPPPAAQARLLGDALAQRPSGHVFLPDVQAQAGQGEEPVAGRRAPDAGAGLRHRYALHAALQAVGPAALPRARRGFLPRHPPRQGLDRHRPDRDLHRDRPEAQIRRRACRPT